MPRPQNPNFLNCCQLNSPRGTELLQNMKYSPSSSFRLLDLLEHPYICWETRGSGDCVPYLSPGVLAMPLIPVSIHKLFFYAWLNSRFCVGFQEHYISVQ